MDRKGSHRQRRRPAGKTPEPLPLGSRLAKLTPPSVHRLFPRRHLFPVLDAILEQARIVWVHAQAGAGKTSLVAQYLDARKWPCLWYQLDEGDVDPATFFYYLKQAACAENVACDALPLLQPEYLGDAEAYSRRFFRALFADFPEAGCLVIDDCHVLPPDAMLHGMLAAGLAEVPAGARVLIISRQPPPPAFARLQANDCVHCLAPERLKLTQMEIAAIAARRWGCEPGPAVTERLQELTQGWMAGLNLFMQQATPAEVMRQDTERCPPEALFDYFGVEILDRLPARTRDMLFVLSVLDEIRPDLARELSGDPEAEARLARLWRDNVFLSRLVTDDVVYRFHPLFRSFLQREARKRVGDEEYRRWQQQGAAGLAEHGMPEAAIALFLDLDAVDDAIPLILEQAERLLQQGRWQTLREWLARLPAGAFERIPWLYYWRGMVTLPLDGQASSSDFARAYAVFHQKKADRAGMLLSAAGSLDAAFTVWDRMEDMDPWLDAIEAMLETEPAFPSFQVEAMVSSAMLLATLFHRPQSPTLAKWTRRVERLQSRFADPYQRFRLTRNLLFYHAWYGDLVKLNELLMATRREIVDPVGSPLDRSFWYLFDAVAGWYENDVARWQNACEEAMRIAWEAGFTAQISNFHGQGVYGSLIDGDLEAAADYLEKKMATTTFERALDASHYYYLSAWLTLEAGDAVEGRRLAERHLEKAHLAGVPFPQALGHDLLAQACFETGDVDGAWASWQQGWALADAIGFPLLRAMYRFTEAGFRLQAGDELAAQQALRDAFGHSRQQGLFGYPNTRRQRLARLCHAALTWNIEPEHVRAMIRRLHLSPPEDVPITSAWPYPVRIFTLGRFSLLIDDTPLTIPVKAQKKPLELLKALIALGGRSVAEDVLAEQLWPDAEGDKARTSLRTTLHRLRKLLGNEAAIILRDGRIGLNPRVVWVDIWSLERNLSEWTQRLHEPDIGRTITAKEAERLLNVFPGDFLANESEASWALAAREHLRARVRQVWQSLARRLEDAGRCALAIPLYSHALGLADLDESLWRGLMRCHAAEGRRGEALAVYARCEQRMRSVLGVVPDERTQKLAGKIAAVISGGAVGGRRDDKAGR